MRNKPFPHFDDFVIIFGKDIAIGEGVETTADAVEVEKDNDEDEQFVNAVENYHEESREEKEEENGEDIAISTCNTVTATSKRKQTSIRIANSLQHTHGLPAVADLSRPKHTRSPPAP